jgi:hypothetical protein
MATLHRPQAIQRFWDRDWSLTTLLVFLIVFIFFIEPLHALAFKTEAIGSVAFTVMLISGIWTVAETHSRMTTACLTTAALLSAGVHWGRTTMFGEAWAEWDAIASGAVFAMLAGIVLSQVFREGPITSPRLQGAVAAYLLVALMFASIYAWIDLRSAAAFTGALAPPGSLANPVERFTYYSFVTLTTLGYGDVVPINPFARSMAALEAFIGQIFPAIMLARLVSMEVYYRQVTGFRGRGGHTPDHEHEPEK